MSRTISLKHGTAAEWDAHSDRVLAAGEPGVETDTGKIKVGDGTTPWSELEYSAGGGGSGTQGATGSQGSPGAQGPQGATGPQGVTGSGTQGVQGSPGAVGPAGLRWRGSWSSSNSYVENDAVAYNGQSYFNISDVGTGGQSPDVASTKWALLSAQGANGPQGPQGIAGTNGTQGPQGATGAQGFQGVAGGGGGGGGTPSIVNAGNLGATYSHAVSATQETWIVGTLNANTTVTLTSLVAGAKALLLLTQDGTGGRTLTVSDGTTSRLVDGINTAAGADTVVEIEYDGTNLWVAVEGTIGPQGAQGAAGSQGAQGAAGAQGATGSQGAQGAAGGGGGSGSVATDTIWDAKGDLAVGTGADTAVRFAAGNNGQQIVADSTQASGLRYGSRQSRNPGPAASGLKGWSYDPMIAGSGSTALAADTLYMVKVPTPEVVTVNNIILVLTSTAAAGMASAYGMIILPDGSIARMTADVSAAVNGVANDKATLALTAALTIGGAGATDFVYAAFGFDTATTSPTAFTTGGSAATNAAVNAGLSAGTYRHGTLANTTWPPTGPFTLSGMSQNSSSKNIWMALS